ncbi:RNA-binding protein 42-like isoform X1 [Papaver somniferum]|uniref:RNA-binding protein 42-like isoform X1 n=1 Tax=Papaver somniferum TaxID=3469 RepID=UPI000E6FC103|nr:RNA-binding protein 42-like isoform X1 [Papaver somniferum]
MANDGSTSSQFTYSNGSYFPLPFHLQQQQQQQPDLMAAYQYPNSQIPPTPTYQIPPPAPSKILMPPPMHPSVYATPAPATTGYTLPQYQQAQQLFQRDALSITPEALESVKAALASSEIEHKSETKKRAIPRKAAGQTWEDPTLAEWPENDYRLFCGDLGNEVNDEVLSKAFTRFPTFNMARVVRDKRTGKTRGFGFVSFGNPLDLAAALKEMNGKYVGNRPIKLRKSSWKERTDMEALEKQKHQSYKKQKQSKKSVLNK